MRYYWSPYRIPELSGLPRAVAEGIWLRIFAKAQEEWRFRSWLVLYLSGGVLGALAGIYFGWLFFLLGFFAGYGFGILLEKHLFHFFSRRRVREEFTRIERELASDDFMTRFWAIELTAANPKLYAKALTGLIYDFPNELAYIIQKLSAGQIGFPADQLRRQMEKTNLWDRKLGYCLALAFFGESIDHDPLMKAIQYKHEDYGLVCKALIKLNDENVLPSLLKELTKLNATKLEKERIISLMEAITALGGELPEGERERLAPIIGNEE